VSSNTDTEQTADLAGALAHARRRLAPPQMPPAPLRVRLKTSPLAHRVLPKRLAVELAVARGQRLWKRNPAEREWALTMMRTIVAGTAQADEREIADLARRALIEREVNKALFWQPWTTAATDDRSSERLEKALSCGRHLLLSSCHLGPIFYSMSVVTSRGRSPYALAGPWFFEQPTPDYWGRRIARWWRGVAERGEHLVQSVGCFPVLEALLREGELVRIHFDLPGSRETRFLGKTVALATGTARLAAATDALVLPMRARRDGQRVWTDIEEPLDSRDFASAGELHDALAATHERLILEMPFALEDPRRHGAWEQGATTSAWTARARTRTA
jgi:lauroyl/myristoyl acyltransferase